MATVYRSCPGLEQFTLKSRNIQASKVTPQINYPSTRQRGAESEPVAPRIPVPTRSSRTCWGVRLLHLLLQVVPTRLSKRHSPSKQLSPKGSKRPRVMLISQDETTRGRRQVATQRKQDEATVVSNKDCTCFSLNLSSTNAHQTQPW